MGVWGVFQAYYQEQVLQDVSPTLVSFIGSVPGLLLTIFSVVTGKLGDRYGYKPFLAAGSVLWVASMLGTAFSTKLWQFFITQGILQGSSCALVFPLIVALPGQWFLKRRALAIGIIVAGSSLGGAIGSLILRTMLSALGLRKSMAIYACIDAALLAVAFLLVEERRKPGPPPKIVWFDKSFLVDPVFWSLGACLMFTVFGYLGPIFFLPTFTRAKVPGISPLLSALPVTILNVSAGIGRTIVGLTADRVGPVNALFFVCVMAGLSQLLVWTFVTNYAGIIGFAIYYGFFCGCTISLSPAVGARIWGSDRLAGLSGLLLMFNIPGNGAGAPVSGALLRATNNNWPLVGVLNGGCQVIGALCLLYARFKHEPRVLAIF
ncbi:MFS general substrate transporter [Panus rudis PR-1116 ss-1]|nr:MFS general substrate transporter [Panus rudis PR-1116 ss-1]